MYLLSVELYLKNEEKVKDLAVLKKQVVDQLGTNLHEMGYSKPTPERPTVEVVVVNVTSNRNFAILRNLSVVNEEQLDTIFKTLDTCFSGVIDGSVEFEYVGSVKRFA